MGAVCRRPPPPGWLIVACLPARLRRSRGNPADATSPPSLPALLLCLAAPRGAAFTGARKPDTFSGRLRQKQVNEVCCLLARHTINCARAPCPRWGARSAPSRRDAAFCVRLRSPRITLGLPGGAGSGGFGEAGGVCLCMWGGHSSTGNLPRSKRLFLDYSPRFPSDQSRESFRQLQSGPLGSALKTDRARGVRKMRSVSPRMRNMRGMGAGMK